MQRDRRSGSTPETSDSRIIYNANRKANIFKQIFYLIKRNLIGALRNPRGMQAVLFVSFFQSMMMCTIFEGVGTRRLWHVEKEIAKMPLWK